MAGFDPDAYLFFYVDRDIVYGDPPTAYESGVAEI
jgi:hypothetical protein